jgi:hypothetical protein
VPGESGVFHFLLPIRSWGCANASHYSSACPSPPLDPKPPRSTPGKTGAPARREYDASGAVLTSWRAGWLNLAAWPGSAGLRAQDTIARKPTGNVTRDDLFIRIRIMLSAYASASGLQARHDKTAGPIPGAGQASVCAKLGCMHGPVAQVDRASAF